MRRATFKHHATEVLGQISGTIAGITWTLFSRLPCRSAFCFSSLRFVFLASGALHSRYSRTAEAPRRRWRFSAELQDRTATEFISKCYTASWEACAPPAQSTTSHWTMLPLQLQMSSWGYLGVTAVFVIGFSVAIFPFFPHFSWHSFLDAPRPGIWTNMHSMNSMHSMLCFALCWQLSYSRWFFSFDILR